ncbi:MAG: PIG-L family deacetylase [Verrucomicrobiae bacterium]|nr:PIG-L family deacetylase [Verrucomicrobiae bacterium]MDW8342862.1 PIG-L family deacetylase [Verrucomicrobiae bacterium]
MKLHQPNADVFIPDGQPLELACRRITHLGIGAHQDDLEFMAFHGIMECFGQADRWFGGVTCTNGGGSARAGPYANYTDEQMMALRRTEQRHAAIVGRYGLMIQLDYPSRDVKQPGSPNLTYDLQQIFQHCHPSVVYTHNPADKHDTHVGVFAAVLRALRRLPVDRRPRRLIGCEVWRNLDWLADDQKVIMDVTGRDNLAAALNGIFDSQIAGGKRYDLATLGRRRANATFFESHATDRAEQLIFGMDLSPLIQNDELDPVEYVTEFIRQFESDVRQRLQRMLG